jgi:processive 1,2-diacylglycerol beta-glucosyltransferase
MVAPLRTPPVRTATARPRVLVVSGSVGAGHDGAARELARRLAGAGAVAEVRDFLDAVPLPVARFLREGYAAVLGLAPPAFEFLFRRLERHGALWRAERLLCAMAEDTVARWIADVRPDVVVSTYPLAGQTLGTMRADGRVSAPVVSYLTDPAVHASWLHPAVDAHLTVTAATARQGELDYGMPFVVAGPLVPERFARVPDLEDLVDLRRELDLPTDRPVALLVAGSLGLGDVVPTVQHVIAAGLASVVLCARNEALRRRLDRVPGAVPLGWRTDVHRLMHVADVLVQNAGGLSFTEAFVAGLPAVTYRPIPGHGRANARVLDAAGLAPWAGGPEELAGLLHSRSLATRTPPVVDDPTDLVLAMIPARPATAAA